MLSTWVCGSPRGALKHLAAQRHERKQVADQDPICFAGLMTGIFWMEKQTHTLNLASSAVSHLPTQGWMHRTCFWAPPGGSDARNGGHDGGESFQNISDGLAIRTLLVIKCTRGAWCRKNDTIWTIGKEKTTTILVLFCFVWFFPSSRRWKKKFFNIWLIQKNK